MPIVGDAGLMDKFYTGKDFASWMVEKEDR